MFLSILQIRQYTDVYGTSELDVASLAFEGYMTKPNPSGAYLLVQWSKMTIKLHRLIRVGKISHKSQVTSHKSQVTSHKSQVTSHKSQVTSHKSQVTTKSNPSSLFCQHQFHFLTSNTTLSSSLCTNLNTAASFMSLRLTSRQGWVLSFLSLFVFS